MADNSLLKLFGRSQSVSNRKREPWEENIYEVFKTSWPGPSEQHLAMLKRLSGKKLEWSFIAQSISKNLDRRSSFWRKRNALIILNACLAQPYPDVLAWARAHYQTIKSAPSYARGVRFTVRDELEVEYLAKSITDFINRYDMPRNNVPLTQSLIGPIVPSNELYRRQSCPAAEQSTAQSFDPLNSQCKQVVIHYPTTRAIPTRKQVAGEVEVLNRSSESSSPQITMSNENTEKSLNRRLGAYFACARTDPYSDEDILNVARLLKHVDRQWSKVPRCYIIFRQLKHLDLLEECIGAGFSDYWLPATERNLPECLRASVKTAFVEKQDLVLTKSLQLEKGTKGQHCYFQESDAIPFEPKGVLGRGAHGQVDRVLSLISYRLYARKRVLRSRAFNGRKKEDVQQFISEIEILKRLSHIHIVELVGSYTDSRYIALIMTPIAQGDLADYIKDMRQENFDELRTFYGCLATGLKYLHDNNVRHKDIKTTNILISANKVVFADFGLSLDFEDATRSTTMSMVNGMTPRYCPPEVAVQAPRNTKADIWSLGIVFLEMLVALKGLSLGEMDDFMEQRGTQQRYMHLNLATLPDWMAHLAPLGNLADNAILSWIEDMLVVDHKSRPTASDLLAAIISISENAETSFCGSCCMDTGEEDFSDYEAA